MEIITLGNNGSIFRLDLENGGQWKDLKLVHPDSGRPVPVIRGFDKSLPFFSTGCFLMFPFVNRLESDLIRVENGNYTLCDYTKDGRGFPVHGLVHSSPRKITDKTDTSVTISPITSPDPEYFPCFEEKFTLFGNSLKVETFFENRSARVQQFSYGYHPYLSLDETINVNQFYTNLLWNVPLTGEMLPDKKKSQGKIGEVLSHLEQVRDKKLDHLFFADQENENPYFGITGESGKILLSVETVADSSPGGIPLPYFQIYTPEDRKSIAIEPMSSSGNSFFFPGSGLLNIQPGEKRQGAFMVCLTGL
ncbi:MAG: aldose 1-epimerase [Leptospira sp.]|nr:aldose 1-epimerase [Leptospira sp.]